MRLLLFFCLSLPLYAQACEDYASWREVNKDCSWTSVAETAVAASSLALRNPTDVSDFCPYYSELSTDQKNKFWVGLLSAMARPESNYKPETTYTEKFKDRKGKKVISRGLLQISIESANGYSCGIKKIEDLHDPTINLQCGVKILDAGVRKNNVIASYIKGKPRGGGLYWSTLRKSRGHLPELKRSTASLPFCKK